MASFINNMLNKLTSFPSLRLCLVRPRRSRPRSRRRSDDRNIRTRSFFEAQRRIAQNPSVTQLQPAASTSSYGSREDDVDQRAQIYIHKIPRRRMIAAATAGIAVHLMKYFDEVRTVPSIIRKGLL
ncbi:unnamed protein product [Citrullus colocynthis]|uniref:Uncharacterized protein n=1 Tax=Citrullus colocynthis TaxID=252529 RepID=A0ABP0YLP5_9ROSI